MNFTYQVSDTSIGFNNSLESILRNRGIVNVRNFLNPTEACVENSNLFDNIELAAKRLIFHLQNNHDVSIVVDCDADGYTSASIMYQYCEELITYYNSKSNLTYVIHDDKKHGLDKVTLNKLLEINPKLIIIPDAGSNDFKEHKLLSNKGIEIIILDHHVCESYSENAIVVNNQLSTKITNKAMTGAGVVYKFAKFIDAHIGISKSDDYLDLLSVGMIADSCDLRNIESRYLTLKGLKQIEKEVNKNELIKSMIKKKSYDMKNKVTVLGIAFYISPLINSIIRNGSYEEKELMFKAFINSDERYVDKIRGKGEVELSIQDYVVRIAEKCKRKQNKTIEEGMKILTEQVDNYNLNKNGVLIVNGTSTIDPNYTGLIANKLTSLYQKPCLLLRGNGEKLTGSGRGFDKKEIKDFREWCNNTNLFNFAEGHNNAFGVSINQSRINKLYEIASTVNNTDDLIFHVDGVFTEKTLNKFIIESISKHDDIWGTSVTEPMFAIDDVNIKTTDIELIGAKKTTIKFKYKDIEFIKFKSNEDEFNNMKQYKAINVTVIGRFGLNTYNGVNTPQINIEAMKYKEGIVKFVF